MEFNRKNTRTITYLMILFFVLLTISQNLDIVFSCFKHFFRIFRTVIAGMCIAFIMNVIMRVFENKILKGMKKAKTPFVRHLLRPLSLILTIIFIFGIITVALLIVIPELHRTILTIVDMLPAFFDRVVTEFYALLDRFNLDLNDIPKIDIDWQSLISTASKYLSAGTNIVIITAADIGANVFSAVTNSIISFVVAIYILLQKEKIERVLKRAVIAIFPEKASTVILNIARTSNELFANFVTGQLTEAVILGSLCFIGMMAFGFPFATIISVLMSITALIPIVGAFIGLTIGALLILIESPIKALFFIIFILCLQQIEGTFIYPKVVGSSIGIPGILVFFAVIVGGNISGILGTLLGVPITALLYTLFKELLEYLEARKAIST